LPQQERNHWDKWEWPVAMEMKRKERPLSQPLSMILTSHLAEAGEDPNLLRYDFLHRVYGLLRT